jgi:hypothetical protein
MLVRYRRVIRLFDGTNPNDIVPLVEELAPCFALSTSQNTDHSWRDDGAAKVVAASAVLVAIEPTEDPIHARSRQMNGGGESVALELYLWWGSGSASVLAQPRGVRAM